MSPRRQRREGGPSHPQRGLRRSIRHGALDGADDEENDDLASAPDDDGERDAGDPGAAGRSAGRRRRGSVPPTEPLGRPPEILLRKLKLAEALERLEAQLRAHAAHGQAEVLVIHGKGQNSAGGVSVLGPEVRRWCDHHPTLVAGWSEAPVRWGGAGAIVVRLRLA
jgi:DNA-nicking Smr family endonuclease